MPGKYDRRTGCEAEWLRWDPRDAKDPAIRSWWTNRHDDALRLCIADFQWLWQFRSSEYVRRELSDEVLLRWAGADPRIRPVENAHYDRAWNVWAGGAEGLVNGFAWAYAHLNGFVRAIRPSRTVRCQLCGETFEENSLPDNFIERLSVDQIDFCTPCLAGSLLKAAQGNGNNRAGKRKIDDFMRGLAEATGRIPSSNFGYDDKGSLWGLSTGARRDVLTLLADRPSNERIKRVYGSWFGALVGAGVLESGAQKMSRGIRSIASDGHVCLSLGERTICELLSREGIDHEKEVPYPEGRFRADFRVGKTLLEYIGLEGNSEYDVRTAAKKSVAVRHSLDVEFITSRELADERALLRRIKQALERDAAAADQ